MYMYYRVKFCFYNR